MTSQGKTALITGGSRGLGLQMAHALGEAGARVVISSRKASDLEEATAELQAANIDARWIAADCSREEDIRRLTSETLQRVGEVDILVNNAGAAWGAPAEDHPLEAWDKVMNLNVRSYFLLSQLIAKASMIPRKKRQHHQHRQSIAGLGGNPSGMKTIAYNTSKGAVINFTRALAAEWGEHGIRVNAICPGFFPSKMTAGTLKAMGEETAGRTRTAAPPGRRRRPQGPDRAVRVGRRQTHHRAVAGRRWRCLGYHGWLSEILKSTSLLSSCSASNSRSSKAGRRRSLLRPAPSMKTPSTWCTAAPA